MITFKATGDKDFYITFMKMQSVIYKFNVREIEVAAEFLLFRDMYIKNPIKGIEIEDDVDGNPIEIEVSMDLFDQLKDKRTILKIMKNLDMSITVFRKHVKSLKDKGFFKGGGIAREFITDGVFVAFNLKKA